MAPLGLKTINQRRVQSANITTVGPDRSTRYSRQQSDNRKAQDAKNKAIEGATMDPVAGAITATTITTAKDYVQGVVSHGEGIVDGIKEGNGWKIGGNTLLLGLDVAPFVPFKGAGAATGTAYRAVAPEFAESTVKNGFFNSGNAGRLGNDGIYANTSAQGAMAEFSYHNLGITPVIFEVKYPISTPLKLNPPGGYFKQQLPFTNGVNILEAPSLRAPGTTNLLIREGAVPGKQIK